MSVDDNAPVPTWGEEEFWCKACRYDLRGLSRTPICPECGVENEHPEIIRARERARRQPPLIEDPLRPWAHDERFWEGQ